jgi:hypothetical protein
MNGTVGDGQEMAITPPPQLIKKFKRGNSNARLLWNSE